jgi:hypothetical protein
MAEEEVLSLDAIDLSSPVVSPVKAASPASSTASSEEKKSSISLSEDGVSLDDIERTPQHVGGQRGDQLRMFFPIFAENWPLCPAFSNYPEITP